MISHAPSEYEETRDRSHSTHGKIDCKKPELPAATQGVRSATELPGLSPLFDSLYVDVCSLKLSAGTTTHLKTAVRPHSDYTWQIWRAVCKPPGSLLDNSPLPRRPCPGSPAPL